MNDTSSTKAGRNNSPVQFYCSHKRKKVYTENKRPSVSTMCSLGADSGVKQKHPKKLVRVMKKQKAQTQCKRNTFSSNYLSASHSFNEIITIEWLTLEGTFKTPWAEDASH